jgi:prevent-host-death family protein
MKVITATEAKNAFGELLMDAQSEPVSITRNGKEQGVLLSSREYAMLKNQLLRAAIQDGRASGIAGDLDISEIKKAARLKAAR